MIEKIDGNTIHVCLLNLLIEDNRELLFYSVHVFMDRLNDWFNSQGGKF